MVSQNTLTTPRILFVDDQPAWLNVMKRYIQKHHLQWNADYALSGTEALNLLRQHRFSAIVTDWKMPGMNGDELVDIVKREFPNVAQIVQSTHDLHTFETSRGDRSIQFFPKGGDLDVLVGLIYQGIEFKKMTSGDSFRNFLKYIEQYPELPEMTITIKNEFSPETHEKVSVAYIDCPNIGLDFRLLRKPE